MNERIAKGCRKVVYGAYSQKGARKYAKGMNGQIMATGLRAQYKRLKRKFRGEK